jgi:signal peptidase I
MSARKLADAAQSTRSIGWPTRVAQAVIVACCLAITAVCLLYCTFLLAGDVFGYQLAQTRGISMEPILKEGDVVLLRTTGADDVAVGEIILYDRNGRLIIHRVTEMHPDDAHGLVIQTKGDNNADYDAPIAAANVRSSFVARLPIRPFTDFYAGPYADVRYLIYGLALLLSLLRMRDILRQRRAAAEA